MFLARVRIVSAAIMATALSQSVLADQVGTPEMPLVKPSPVLPSVPNAAQAIRAIEPGRPPELNGIAAATAVVQCLAVPGAFSPRDDVVSAIYFNGNDSNEALEAHMARCSGLELGDLDKAYVVIESAAELGDFVAIAKIASMPIPSQAREIAMGKPSEWRGRPELEDEISSRISLLKNAMMKGSLAATAQLASHYERGAGVEKDLSVTVAYYSALAEVTANSVYRKLADYHTSSLSGYEIEQALKKSQALLGEWAELEALVL
jgi:TPR repeat protein